MQNIVNVQMPSADGVPEPSGVEVTALVNLIRSSASEPGKTGRKVSLDMVARAVGVQRNTLWAWMRKPPKPVPGVKHNGRGMPYSALFLLQVLLTNPAAARAFVFLPMWDAQSRPNRHDRARAPDTP